MTEPEFVSVRTAPEHPGIGTIALSRPPTNTFTRQMYRELAQAAAEANAREDIRVVIVYGGHEIFCAGDDLAELGELTGDEMARSAVDRQAAITAVAELAKPTVAAITGYALGSGLELALAADWRIAGDNVKVGSPEILVGMIPGGGGTARLARVVGLSRAKEMVFSGRFVGAEEARGAGLIDQMVAPDDVYTEAAAWARRFVDGPPRALAAAKQAMDYGFDSPLVKALDRERELFCQVFATQDRVDGVAAHLEIGPGTARFRGA
ncbi:enoyl-CoA hydratase [Mycobacterium sp. CBMA271]|uniref:enoyl-CoA hydratase n=1 Tax=unclassified Mycobacteroides TaxID=2618759 RepID=UPI0012DFC00A|nr:MULTISPECIES: enoyl-CoA hydratase [unclassified Mycobacteroides]MUM19475.1 enoyl-CoA hydratase [Mycobacteroides sp. CBMA 326]MUM20366.1 enoyl-CoA hydratase [Mycobacteroides sp. CBMA 271]